MSFKDLKKSRKSLLNKIQEKQKQEKGTRERDDRFWRPTIDDAGNGKAVIRFLPPANGEDIPYVRLFSHFFQGPGGWYIENSLTTLNQDDPVSEYNSKLWNSTEDDDSPARKQARNQKRKLNYIANIYVVSDPKNKENEGKVFLYQFGQKIFDKINLLMSPEYDDEDPVNPFDFWEGANFELRIRKVEGYRNYDSSKFLDPAPLKDDDKELEEIYNQEYALQPFIDPSNFKSYAELEARLKRVLGTESINTTAEEDAYEDDDEAEAPSLNESSEDEAPWKDDEAGEDDDDLDFFKNLTKDE